MNAIIANSISSNFISVGFDLTTWTGHKIDRVFNEYDCAQHIIIHALSPTVGTNPLKVKPDDTSSERMTFLFEWSELSIGGIQSKVPHIQLVGDQERSLILVVNGDSFYVTTQGSKLSNHLLSVEGLSYFT